ncbi:MurR/RpiR family transcriptional regulator [Streptococcus uberis]|uniref:MurR/RpiR family transcriptional regulator n=1 Tax=Streptococcus uberis TaxID=1349 RepID=UPI0012B636FC|nr:MurR/RpiR family transcriptional regulator [Streptococcus uberis]MCK1167203.1 MurR/RpiR family transcriptional regulator [Streptococcus uberis]MCK1169187.1 MurR/RpiR family transcriptional regulator [Streptococcus uberis]MCK1187701.1 MurR/RpiR family transcriptional regulator [Streptococcus uberis]MCK1212827.1 MurR/RpiR family transcriptional regulator [Streptococcus uberis]MCK1242599.1 MurR/RpiR family transcriptional regulator [Streptococcus uberis]
MTEWEVKVNQYYTILTEQELSIISFIENHSEIFITMTSQQLADACFVSRSSISRLLKKMAIDSFAELKYLVSIESSPENKMISNFSRVVERYHTYIDQIFEKQDLKQLVDLLVSTQTLYVYGTGNAQKMEVESLRQLFSSVGLKVVVFFDKGEFDYIKSNLSENDLVLLLSYKGESAEAMSILKDLAYRETKSIVMTQTSNNSMSRLADYKLYVPTESINTPTKRTYEVSTTFYFIIDQLFYDYCVATERI